MPHLVEAGQLGHRARVVERVQAEAVGVLRDLEAAREPGLLPFLYSGPVDVLELRDGGVTVDLVSLGMR